MTSSGPVTNAKVQVAFPTPPPFCAHLAGASCLPFSALGTVYCFWGDLTLSSAFLFDPISQGGGGWVHRERRSVQASWSTLPLLLFSKPAAEGPSPWGKEGHNLISPFSWGHRQKGRRGHGLLVAAAPYIRLSFPRTQWVLPSNIYISWTHWNT